MEPWDQGSKFWKLWDRGSKFQKYSRDWGSKFRKSFGIRDQHFENPWDWGSKLQKILGSGIKIPKKFGIRDQNSGRKYRIRVTSLELLQPCQFETENFFNGFRSLGTMINDIYWIKFLAICILFIPLYKLCSMRMAVLFRSLSWGLINALHSLIEN